MFKIESTRPIEWPAFKLRKGVNEFPTRRAVPEELWIKLDRLRSLNVISFEGPAEVGKEKLKLAELTQVQLYALDKATLADLAKAEGVSVPDGAGKSALLAALENGAAPAVAPEPTDPAPAKRQPRSAVTVE